MLCGRGTGRGEDDSAETKCFNDRANYKCDILVKRSFWASTIRTVHLDSLVPLFGRDSVVAFVRRSSSSPFRRGEPDVY
jgi:hypothetical protein